MTGPPRLSPPGARKRPLLAEEPPSELEVPLWHAAALLGGISLAILATTSYLDYQRHLEDRSSSLLTLARSQARLLEALTNPGREGARHGDQARDTNLEEALARATESLNHNQEWLRGSFELVIGERTEAGPRIRLRAGAGTRDLTTLDRTWAKPLRLALEGETGVVDDLDYTGVRVLAAHVPLRSVPWGLVVKRDFGALRRELLGKGLLAGLVSFFGVTLAAFLGLWRWRELVRKRGRSSLASRHKAAVLELVRNVLEVMHDEDTREEAPRHASQAVRDAFGARCAILLEVAPGTSPPGTLRQHPPLFTEADSAADSPRCVLSDTSSWREPVRACLEDGGVHMELEPGPWPLAPAAPGAPSEVANYLVLPARTNGPPLGALVLTDLPGVPRSRDLEPLARALGQVLTSLRARERFLETQDELRLLQVAIESLEESVVITDARGTIAYVNPQMEATSGYARDELVGRNPRILRHPDQSDGLYADLWQTLTAGRPWQGRFRNVRKDGTEWTEAANISPIRNADGRITHYVKVAHDLSEELELERKLRQAQRMEAVATLSAGVAHEFNNLLGIVTGYVELTIDELPADAEESRDDLGRVLEACDRGAGLVNRLLTFSRQSEGVPVRFDLQMLIKETTKMLREATPASVQIEVSTTPGKLDVFADPSQLRQLVVSLVNNAVEAYEGGSGVVQVDLAGTDKLATLRVVDQGVGMTPEVLAQARDPFFTTRRDIGGSGLGLSITHGILADLMGSLVLESEPGVGTRAIVTIPLAPAATSVAPRPGSSGGLTGRAMVVDDEPDLVVAMKRALEGLGLSVQGFTDPGEAIAYLREGLQAPDVLLTDLAMPGHDGRAVARVCREVHPGTQILCVTGFDATSQPGGLGDGLFDDRLTKPVRKAVLADALRELFSKPRGT